MRYSLRQLEVFLATAQYENVTRAADSLAMSQSAASSSLKDLEQQFSVQLFDRVGKRLQLSELGNQLRPQAENLLAQARAFEQALVGEDVVGRLHIGATLTIGNYLAVGMIAEFRRRNPQADIALSVANTQSSAERVAGFELDMGLIEGEFHHPDLETLHWRPDELVVFAAPGHPLASASGLTDPDLLFAEIDMIDKRQVSVDNQELYDDVIAIAVPIKDKHGRFYSSLAIQAPVSRISADSSDRYLPLLREAAQELSLLANDD